MTWDQLEFIARPKIRTGTAQIQLAMFLRQMDQFRAIDILDLNIAGKAYGSFEGDPEYDPEADLNKDGHIDMRDLAVVGRNYGKTC